MNRKQALKVLAACLAVATVLSAYYTVRTVVAYREFEIIYYLAEEIDHSDVAWNLTEPDPYILEAISLAPLPPIEDENHPGGYWEHWVRARRNETTFIDQVREHDDVWEIAYNGSYYYVECLGSVDPHPSPDLWVLPKYFTINGRRVVQTEVIAADIGLGALWVVWAIGWRKTKPTQ